MLGRGGGLCVWKRKNSLIYNGTQQPEEIVMTEEIFLEEVKKYQDKKSFRRDSEVM